MNDLAAIRKVSKSDLKHFLTQDHTSFTVLSVSTKHIESTDRISVTLSKNSARSFYLGQEPKNSNSKAPFTPQLPDDCLQDAQNLFTLLFLTLNKRSYILDLKIKSKVISRENKPAVHFYF